MTNTYHVAQAMGVGRGGRGWPRPPLDFEIIGKKGYFFQFRRVKNKTHFWPTWKNLGKSPTAPPGKNLSDAHGTGLKV